MASRESLHTASVIELADAAMRFERAWSDMADATGDLPAICNEYIRLAAVRAARSCGVSPAPAALIEYLRDVPSVIDEGLTRWQKELKARRDEYELSAAGM